MKNHVNPEDIKVFGAGMAAQCLGADVKITITQDIPADGEAMAFTMKLWLMKDGEYTQVDLSTPIVIRIALPDGVKAEGLTIRHIKMDGSEEILTPQIEGRTAVFMATSFSNFLFIEAKAPAPGQGGSKPTVGSKPTSSSARKTVDTGDQAPLAATLIVMAAALIVIVVCAAAIRRRHRHKT